MDADSSAHDLSAPASLPQLQHRFTALVNETRLLYVLQAKVSHLPEADRDDRIAEGLAAAWRAFRNKAIRFGVLLEARHVVWVAIRTAGDNRRRLVGGDDTKCVLSPANRNIRTLYENQLEVLRSRPLPYEVRDDVRKYMGRAKPAEREILQLHVEGHGPAEIGRQLGLSRSGARRRLARVCQAMRRRARRRCRPPGRGA